MTLVTSTLEPLVTVVADRHLQRRQIAGPSEQSRFLQSTHLSAAQRLNEAFCLIALFIGFVSPDKQEYLIFNHSVKHPQCPPKGHFFVIVVCFAFSFLFVGSSDGFIRAISFDTGYHITVSGDDCEMRCKTCSVDAF